MDKYQNKIYSTLSTKLKKRESDLIDIIKKDFKKNFDGDILDIGCASGNLLIAISKIFPETKLIGIDSHKQSIERLQTTRDQLRSQYPTPETTENNGEKS